MIALGLDPLSIILRHITIPSLIYILLLALNCFLFYYFSHVGWFCLASVVLTVVIQLHYGFFLMDKALKLVKDLCENLLQKGPKKGRVNLTYKRYKKQVAIIREVLYTIKLFRLVLPLVDEAVFLILPFLLLVGEIVFVSCNYATIKMYDSIPMPFFLILPGFSGVLIFLVQILFPSAASVFENSSKSLQLLKSLKIVATDKIWIRIIRATRPPRFNFGSMFYAKRSTKTTYFTCWLNDTMNALILI